MIYGEPKSVSAVLPIVAIQMAMAGCIVIPLSNVDRVERQHSRVLIQVQQPELGK